MSSCCPAGRCTASCCLNVNITIKYYIFLKCIITTSLPPPPVPYVDLVPQQVAPYRPDPATLGTQRAATMLWRIFTAIMKDVGVKPSDFASCTTDSGSDFESMCVNHASEYGILWDWCTSDMISKVFEHAFGTSAKPSNSKNPAAQDLIKVVIKVVERLNRSTTWRTKFDDIHVSFTLPTRLN